MSRVLLIYHSPLFAHSVRVALSGQPQITLVGELADWARAAEEMTRLAPDVMILEEDEREATEALLSLLSHYPLPWRVVAMQLGNPSIHVWSGAWQPLRRQEDLLSAVRI